MNIKILYCEDEEITRSYIVKRLLKFSKNIFVASDGKEGLELYREHQPDLIITDLSMPNLDGLDFIKIVRKDDKKTTIVVVSAFSDNEKLLECIEQNVNQYILKPVKTSRITDIIHEVEDKLKGKKEANRYKKHLQQYRKAFETGSIVSVTDPRGRITYVNDAFCQTTGYTKEELVGQQHNILRHPNMPSKEFKKLWNTILNKEVYQGVIESRTKSGSSYITDTTIVPILDDDDEVYEFVAIRHNLTAITDAYERNIKTIIDNDEALMVVINEFYDPIIFNKMFEKEFGTIGKNFKMFDRYYLDDVELISSDKNEEDDTAKLIDFVLLVKSREKQQCKIKVEQDDGEVKIYMVKVSSIRNELVRQRVYHLLSFLDITEFERMKDEQFSKSKLAYIGQLSASITHEINTPLTYIKGNLELMKMDIEDSKDTELKSNLLESVDTMEGGIGRISSIIDTMRQTTGVSEDETQEINLYETIIYSCRMIYSRSKHIANIYINDEKFTPELDKHHENFTLFASPQKLEQVWIILLNNALDELEKQDISFSERSIKIEIQQNLSAIKVLFKDNAGGIPESILDKIFDSFISTKKSSTSAGMGLGLNIAHTIITSSHGTITAYNEDGGAVFKILFE